VTSPDPLTDLTAEVRQVTGKHQDWLQLHGQMLSELVPNHELVTWLVAEMREHVNVLLAEVPAEVKYPAINWATCSAEDAETVWDELGEWVRDILVARFHPSRRELPDCWPLHVGAVENLLWLQRCWRLAFTSRAHQSLAAEWYTRWRADALRELADAVEREATSSRAEKCSVGMHLGHLLPGAKVRPASPQTPLQPPTMAPAAAAGYGGQLPPGVDPTAPGAQVWAQVPTPTGQVKVDEPANDLAAAEHWWPQLLHARQVDLSQRRAREKAAADAKAAAKAAADERLADRYRDEDGAPPPS
jgi:hypothetical protein